VLAAGAGCELEIVDVACAERPRAHPRVRTAALAAGTRNLALEPAMTLDAWRAAFHLGAERARQAARDGVRVAIAGEVGIGNTTAASALAALLLGVDAEHVVGRGAGADAAQLERKVAAVRSGVARAREIPDPETAMAAVGGFEIAAMAGFQAECAAQQIVLLLDGTIATAALLCAEALRPGTRGVCIAAHRSPEPAHARMLQHLDLEAHLDWGLCLGEGTGALLVLPLLDAAASILGDMATFDDLGFAVP
jgi:nicotinate-nucleotide--dimethylbenzimidazole phosphoribosyltransferase